MNVTAQILIDAVGCTPDRAYLFAAHLDDACDSYAINTPERLAAFLAQVGHESGSLRYVREIASGEAYEGRRDLGNIQPGDGARFRGRGLLQITGRDNVAATTSRLVAKFNGAVPNFVDEPEALEQPRWAAISAADWWNSRGLNALADVGDFDRITKIINGGTNGQHDRRQRWERAKRVLAAYQKEVQTYPDTEQPTLQIGRETPEMQGYQAKEDAAAGDPVEYPQPEPVMAPFIAAGLSALIQNAPALIRVFGNSPQAEKNAKAAETVAAIAMQATGQPTVEGAVRAIESDPAKATAYRQAIESRWMELTEVGGGIEAARKADDSVRASADFWLSPSFWIAIALLPLVYMLVASLIGLLGTASWSDDVRAGLSGSIISAIVGGLVGYYYGQTTSRNRT